MNSEKKSPEIPTGEPASDASPTIDEFIKELEEKEKTLKISPDVVVQIEESDISEAENLALLKFLDSCEALNHSAAAPQPVVTDYPAYNQKIADTGSEVVKLREQISKLEAERAALSELARRRQSDFDSYRKRTERERGELMRNLVSNVATQLLPVIDNLGRALDASFKGEKSQDFQQFLDGIGLVNQQLGEVLTEMGVAPIISVGELFDPHLHEAVAAEQTSKFPPHTVIAELLRGYRLDDKIIRHSLVKVSTTANSEASAKNSAAE